MLLEMSSAVLLGTRFLGLCNLVLNNIITSSIQCFEMCLGLQDSHKTFLKDKVHLFIKHFEIRDTF